MDHLLKSEQSEIDEEAMVAKDSDELEDDLHQKLTLARQIIKKYTNEIDKLMKDPGDVMDLSNRVYLIENGYLSIGSKEKGIASVNYKHSIP